MQFNKEKKVKMMTKKSDRDSKKEARDANQEFDQLFSEEERASVETSGLLNKRPIGMVIGASKPYDMIVSIDRRQLHSHPISLGEFVAVPVTVGDKPLLVVGILKSVTMRNIHLLEDLLTDPYFGRKLREMGALEGGELVEGMVQVIGFLEKDEAHRLNLKLPRVPARPGTPAYLADDETLRSIFTDRGHVRVGALVVRPDVEVRIDVKRMLSRHFAILAITGAGKSNTVAVLTKALATQLNGSVILVDPHDDFSGLATEESLAGRVKLFSTGAAEKGGNALRFRLDKFSDTEISRMLRLPSSANRQLALLFKALKTIRKRQTDGFSLEELAMQIDVDTSDDEAKSEDLVRKRSLLERFEQIPAGSMFHKNLETRVDGTQATGLVNPGQVSVISLAGLEDAVQQVAVARTLKKLFDAGVASRAQSDRERLPCATLVIIEEGHRFAPASDEPSSLPIIKKIAGEGRKFGVGLGIVSQRPGKLNADVLSQCNSQFILRIRNPHDKEQIRSSSEAISEEIMAELPNLDDGQAIILGSIIPYPVLAQIDHFTHDLGGQDRDILGSWQGDLWSDPTGDDIAASLMGMDNESSEGKGGDGGSSSGTATKARPSPKRRKAHRKDDWG